MSWFTEAVATAWGWLWRNRREIVGIGEWADEGAGPRRRWRYAKCPTCGNLVPCSIVRGRYRAICPLHGLSNE